MSHRSYKSTAFCSLNQVIVSALIFFGCINCTIIIVEDAKGILFQCTLNSQNKKRQCLLIRIASMCDSVICVDSMKDGIALSVSIR